MLLWPSNIQEIYAHQCVGMGKGIYYYIILLLSFVFITIITIIIIVIIIHHYRVDYHVDFPVDTWWLCIFTECRCLPVHWCKAGHHGRSEKGSEFGTIRCSLVDPMNFRQFPWFFHQFPMFFVVVFFLDLLWYPTLQLFRLFVRIRLSTAEDVAVGKFPWSI